MADVEGRGPVRQPRPLTRAIIAAIAVATIAFCAWSMSQYVAGNDPLAFLGAPSQTQAVTGDAGSPATASASAATDAAASPTSAASTAVPSDAADATDVAAETGQTAVGAPARHAADDASAQAAPASSERAPSAITVSVTVDGSAAGAGSASATLSLSPGATPYDALVAAGASVNARSTAYGTYVAGIDGLAEREHGGQSGWVYAVNGSEPSTACSNYALADGDSVTWTYVNVEY